MFKRTMSFCKQTVETLNIAFDLGLQCLHMSHKQDTCWILPTRQLPCGGNQCPNIIAAALADCKSSSKTMLYVVHLLYDFLGAVKAAPHECVRTVQP